jgi:dethiobiotin synthase
MMLRGVFVTGTDTGVGKTIVSAALLIRYQHEGAVRYWKPIQTGIEQDDDTAEVQRLSGAGDDRVLKSGVRLPRPLSPHLAARLNDFTIFLPPLVNVVKAEAPKYTWIVEGAGGVMVPLNESETMADLMTSLALPVVVAARSGLGTINHTLLTIEALRRRSLPVAGVVMVGDPNPENTAAVERYGRTAVLGEMPIFTSLTPERLAAWATTQLDRDRQLVSFFRTP